MKYTYNVINKIVINTKTHENIQKPGSRVINHTVIGKGFHVGGGGTNGKAGKDIQKRTSSLGEHQLSTVNGMVSSTVYSYKRRKQNDKNDDTPLINTLHTQRIVIVLEIILHRTHSHYNNRTTFDSEHISKCIPKSIKHFIVHIQILILSMCQN